LGGIWETRSALDDVSRKNLELIASMTCFSCDYP
jgi:hypothetical protein